MEDMRCAWRIIRGLKVDHLDFAGIKVGLGASA